MLKNTLLFFSALLISLIFIEIVLRIVAPPVQVWIGDINTKKSRLYGWAPAPNIRTLIQDPDTGEAYYFRTNSQGWKDVEHAFEKPPATTRILIIGDSHTYGIVSFGQEYHRQLENIFHEKGFNNVEVIGIGVGGWGTDQEMEVLINEGIKYSPDIVILQFCANDILEISFEPYAELTHFKPFTYRLIDGELTKIERERPKNLKLSVRRFFSWSSLYFNLKLARYKVIDLFEKKADNDDRSFYEKKREWREKIAPPADTLMQALFDPDTENQIILESWDLFEALLLNSKKIAEASGAEFLVFSEAGDSVSREWNLGWGRIIHNLDQDYFEMEGGNLPIDFFFPLHKLETICQKQGIPLIAPGAGFHRYELNPHTDNKGNLEMAETIMHYLIDYESFRSILKSH